MPTQTTTVYRIRTRTAGFLIAVPGDLDYPAVGQALLNLILANLIDAPWTNEVILYSLSPDAPIWTTTGLISTQSFTPGGNMVVNLEQVILEHADFVYNEPTDGNTGDADVALVEALNTGATLGSAAPVWINDAFGTGTYVTSITVPE